MLERQIQQQVSIPYSTIKIKTEVEKAVDQFVSIPYSTIKINLRFSTFKHINSFNSL